MNFVFLSYLFYSELPLNGIACRQQAGHRRSYCRFPLPMEPLVGKYKRSKKIMLYTCLLEKKAI